MTQPTTSRRRFLQLAGAGAAAGGTLLGVPDRTIGAPLKAAGVTVADEHIRVDFDGRMRWRIWLQSPPQPRLLSDWTAPDGLTVSALASANEFVLAENTQGPVTGAHGAGVRHTLRGHSGTLEKTVEVELYERHPGLAVVRVSYRNRAPAALHVRGWSQGAVRLLPGAGTAEPAFWNYCGSTHEDRRDWVRPVEPGYSQDNFMGMTTSDYGGGTPSADVWRRDAGLAVGHLALMPLEVSLPVRRGDRGVDLAITAVAERVLASGETFATAETFVSVHRGDHFATLTRYRALMTERGLGSPPAPAPASAYEAIWCAWGYERDCTLELIRDTLPKVKELGLGWAVIDDGWQSNVGDWNLNLEKYPNGLADMNGLVKAIRDHDLKPRLWFAPLAAAPGSDVLHDHTDMLLLDKDGAPQAVTWWNSLYLCPAYPKTQKFTQDLVRRFVGEWGFDGLKIDGQHLNGVAPCYNPAHNHASPEDSVTHLRDFLYGMYKTAMETHPQACIELCPCGTAYTFYSFPAFNQAPASDPESSWQVRHKGKTLKGLLGPGATFAGDHVELSDGGDDFASTVGVGAVVSTKFTWPRDPKPKDSFLLTPEREVLWRRWIALYNERLLSRGTYRGELYDIGFDRPETHAIEKDGRLYYAFYAPQFSGEVTLRGLGAGRYRVRDYFAGADLGEVAAGRERLAVSFAKFLVVEAIPA